MSAVFSITPEDVIYCTLPLYHSGGTGISVGACLVRGNTVVLRQKFSASNFWDECIETKATVTFLLELDLFIHSFCRLSLNSRNCKSVIYDKCN